MSVSAKPVVIDGGTFITLGALAAVIAALNSDEAAKYITPQVLFFSKMGANTLNAGFLALKMFRSQAYAGFVQEKKQNGTTPPFPKP